MSDGLSNDAYGRTVSMTTDGITDTYLVGGAIQFAFPAGTSQAVVYLSIAVQTNLQQFMAAIQAYVQLQFPIQVQNQLSFAFQSAQYTGKTNRATYLAQLLTWLDAILTYSATFVANVKAQTDPSVVAGLMIDLSQVPATPNVTLVGAIAIPN